MRILKHFFSQDFPNFKLKKIVFVLTKPMKNTILRHDQARTNFKSQEGSNTSDFCLPCNPGKNTTPTPKNTIPREKYQVQQDFIRKSKND